MSFRYAGLLAGGLLLGLAVGYYFGYDVGFEKASNENNSRKVTSFDECAAFGNPVMESYPRQCRADGITYTEDIGNELDKSDLIKITNPRPNQIVSSPLEITGEARGLWFFEASFPVYLYDGNGKLVSQGLAQADGEWMTEDFVRFTSNLTFVQPKTKIGKLVLMKDNPSGILEKDDELRIPVVFD